MKNVKKLLALLLALVMLFAFCACNNNKDEDNEDDKKEGTSQSEKNDEDDKKEDTSQSEKNDEDDKLTESKLEGEWEATLDMAAIAVMVGEDVSMYDELGIDLDKCTLEIVFEDGEATLKLDGMVDWYVDMMETVIDWCYEGDNMLEFVAKMMSVDGEEYTADDIAAMLEEQGTSIEDVLDEYFGEIDLDEMADEMAKELTDEVTSYELDGDELIFEDGESVWEFSYSNGKIYILSVEENGEVTELSKGDFVLEK